MRWRMQHGVLIKWRGILRPELNATLHHPLRRGSSYKLLPIVAPPRLCQRYVTTPRMRYCRIRH